MIKHNTNIDYRKTLDVARVHNAALRENPDYTAETKPASLWAFLAAIIVTLIGGIVFGLNYHGGSYQKFVKNYQPVTPGGVVEKAKEETAFERGRKIYTTNCASCHQASGNGVAGMFPPLAGSEWVTGSDERLGLILLYGMSGPVTVKGQKYSGANQMPGWASIGDQKIADVLTYIRNEWGNKASEVSAAGIKDLRSRHPGRTNPSTEEELLKIPDTTMLQGGGADNTSQKPANGHSAAPAASVAAEAKPIQETAAYERGRKVYNTNCASCHQASGNGIPGLFPPLAGSEWVTGSDERLVLILLYGMSGPVTVKGQKYSGANQMPGWASIGDDKIADVSTYIRNEWGNKASEVSTAGVKDLKSRYPGRANPTTEEELLKIPDTTMLPSGAAQ